MRILLWTDAYYPEIGGLEVFCLQLARGLVKLGHEVEVITGRSGAISPQMSLHDGIPVHGFGFSHALINQDLAALRVQNQACAAVLDRFDPDLIHVNVVNVGIFNFVLQQRRRRRPTVLTVHDTVFFVNKAGLAGQALTLIDGVIAISNYVSSVIVAAHPEIAGRTRTILNALPMPESFSMPPKSDQSILAFGRIAKEKGFDLAIQAFAQIARRFPEATLTIAGDGVERANLQALAQSTGLADRIHFPGWIHPDAMNDVISRHAFVVMPPRWQEPFGLVALQTAQCGRAIVATHSGAIPEIVVDGVTGRIVPINDTGALAQGMEELLSQPKLGHTWGQAARVRAREQFSFDVFLQQYEETFLHCAVVDRNRAASPA